MAKRFRPGVITANRLIEGDVVYLTASGTWSGALQDAAYFEHEDVARLCLEQASGKTDRVVDTYIAAAERDAEGHLRPARLREVLRAQGPGNYRHGKRSEA